jgi:hypothetical protein
VALEIGETIKEHPKATAAFVVVGVIVLYLLFNSGGGSASSGVGSPDQAQVQSATDAYIAQQQAQTQSQGIAASLMAQQDQISGALQGLQIQSTQTTTANQLQAGVDLAQINAQQQESELANTLSADVVNRQNTLAAQVAENAVNAQVTQAQISANTTLGTTQMVANALVQENTNQTQVNLAQIGAARDVQLTQAAVIQNVKTQSWLSKIFG